MFLLQFLVPYNILSYNLYHLNLLDLKLAVYDLIKYYLKDERKARMQIAGAMVENQVSSSIRGNTGFPDHIKRILEFYKIYK